jgi:hypothetical protein
MGRRGHEMLLEHHSHGYAYVKVCSTCGQREAGDYAGHRFAIDMNFRRLPDATLLLEGCQGVTREFAKEG